MCRVKRFFKLKFIFLLFFMSSAATAGFGFKVLSHTYIEIPANKGFKIVYTGSPPNCSGVENGIEYMAWKTQYIDGHLVYPVGKVKIVDPDGVARCKVQFYSNHTIGYNSECYGIDATENTTVDGDPYWEKWFHWIHNKVSSEEFVKIKTCS